MWYVDQRPAACPAAEDDDADTAARNRRAMKEVAIDACRGAVLYRRREVDADLRAHRPGTPPAAIAAKLGELSRVQLWVMRLTYAADVGRTAESLAAGREGVASDKARAALLGADLAEVAEAPAP